MHLIIWKGWLTRTMLYTIINPLDIYYSSASDSVAQNVVRSSNPCDYIRGGYYLDNAALFGGNNNVNLNCDFSSHISGNNMGIPTK